MGIITILTIIKWSVIPIAIISIIGVIANTITKIKKEDN